MKAKTTKLLGENIEYLHDLGIEKDFFNLAIMSTDYEGKNDKSVYIVYKNFCLPKTPWKEQKNEMQIITTHIPHKGFIRHLYEGIKNQ